MSGPLDFKADIDDKKFNAILNGMEKRIKGTGDLFEKTGQGIDRMFDATFENVNIQKSVIKDLETSLKELDRQVGKTPAGKVQAELRKEAALLRAELKREEAALSDLETAVKSNQASHATFYTELRKAKDALVEMEMAGKRNTEAYDQQQQKVAQLTQAMNHANRQARELAHDQAAFQGLISGFSGLAGAASAATGSVGLFAGENENLQKIMLKVQSLMAITIGLQQVQKTLHKDSAFMLVTVAKGKQLLATANTRLAVGLGISNVAAKALMATLTLGLSVAITGAIVLIDRMVSKQREQAKLQQEFDKRIVESSYKSISALEQLSAAWGRIGDDLKLKEQFVRSNQEAFEDLGVAVKDVNEAERLMVSEKDAFISAQMEKARAVAARALADEKFQELLLKERELEAMPNKEKGAFYSPLKYSRQENELKESIAALKAEINEFYSTALDAENAAVAAFGEAGFNAAGSLVEGSIAALEQSISELKDKYRSAATDKERLAFLQQIQAQEKELDQLLGKKGKVDDPVKNLSQTLQETQKLYEAYYSWAEQYGKESADKQFEGLVQGGKSFLEYLEGQIAEIEGKAVKTTQDRDSLSLLMASRNDITGAQTRLQLFKDEIQSTKDGYTSLVDYIEYLRSRLETDVTFDGSEESLDKVKTLTTELSKAQEAFSRNSVSLYEELRKQAADYAQQRIIAEEEYEAKVKQLDRETLGEEKYQEAMEALKKYYSERLSVINGEELKASEAYKKIGGEIANLTRREAMAYIKALKDQLALLDDQSDAYKQIAGHVKKAENTLKNNMVNQFDDISNGLREAAALAGQFDENIGKALETASQLVSAVGKIAAGDIVGGSMQIAAFAFNYIANLGMQAERKAEAKRQESVNLLKENLSQINSLLDKQIAAIDRLTGTDKLEAFAISFRTLRGEITSIISKLDGMELFRKLERGGISVGLDSLIKTYNELFQGGGRGGGVAAGGSDLEIIDRLINENQKAIDKLYKEILEGKLSGNQAEEVRLLIEALEQNTAEFEQLKSQYEQYLLGFSSESVVNSIMDGFREGKVAAADFADTFEELMRKAILQSIKTQMLEGPIKAWMEDFAKRSEDGLDTADVEALRTGWMSSVGEAAKDFEEMDAMFGDLFSGLFDDSSFNSLSGAIKGVTEETAGLVAGQMNAIRMNQAHSLNLMNSQLLELSQIAHNTSYNHNLQFLREIRDLIGSQQQGSISSQRADG